MKYAFKAIFLTSILSILGANYSFGDQIAVSNFKGGINNNNNPLTINNDTAQDLLNVDITPGGLSVKKRDGYGLYKALSTTQAMHGGFHAFDSTGNDYQLWGSSRSLFGIVAGGTPTTLVSSATLNSTWDCADTQGYSYCVNSSRDAYIRTDGATKTWYTSPLGTMVEVTPDRVVVAGVSGTPNTLYVSQSNTFTNFVTGVNDTDAFTEVIASQGSKLTHIRWACGKLLWWKDQSFGYFDFDNQYTAQVKTISDTIGTFDNTSAVDPGGRVWFRGQDGHTWMYDCSALSKESVDITPYIQASGNRTSNFWTQTSDSDFNSGRTSSSTVLSGTVYISSNNVDSVANKSFETGTNPPTDWTYQNYTGTGLFSTGLGGTTCSCTMTPFDGSRVASFSSAHNGGATYTANITAVDVSSTILTTTAITNGGACSWASYTLPINGTNSGRAVKVMLRQTGKNSLFADQDYRAYSSSFTMSNDVTVRAYSNPFNSASTCDQNLNYFDYITGGQNTISTGVFISQIKNAPNLTSWNTFSANTSGIGGINTFSMRSSTSVFTTLSSTPAWTVQSNGSLITISTGTYFQVMDTFTVTNATQTAVLNDFTVNWFEGTTVDQAYLLYFDNAIWESVAYGSGQSVNNYIFKRDLINDSWTFYNFGAGGMLVQANTLYFGDTTAGNVFNYGTTTSDNGTAIQSYWKSKEFSGTDPFLQTQLTNIDTIAKRDQGSTLTATYAVETSTETSYSIGLSSTTNSIIQSRKLLPSGKLGYTFSIKYGDTSTSSAWEFMGFRIGFTQNPYRPQN